jgi:cyclopropane-fatty-acyl-phospholipid synthase
VSNDFYAAWLDPTMTYSCAYFETGDETLEQAQVAKMDLSLRKLGLGPGHRLLDIGCGWGATAERAVEVYGAEAVGLTLSAKQHEYAARRVKPGMPLSFRFEGWETYRESCDRIVSIGAFEHFTVAKYPAYFGGCHDLLSEDGLMLLHTITVGRPSSSFAVLRYAYFVWKEVFQGGELPRPEQVVAEARKAGFELLHAESLRPHYVRTIDAWLQNLEKNREAAIRASSEEVYERYLTYLHGAQKYHAGGETGVYQFLFRRD